MQAGTTTRIERPAFLATASLVFLYVTARAFTVPITHDEAMTFFIYVETGSFLPFLSHWDAGNHLLCTALAWACYKALGFHLWALRLPSVLAFALYAWYAWRIGVLLRDHLVRWCFWAAVLMTPFLVDFFSLFRGYGLAMAFLLMALHALFGFIEQRRTRTLMALLMALALAAFSSLSIVTLWGIVLLIAAMVIMRPPVDRKRMTAQLVLWVIAGVGPIAFAAFYLKALAAHGTLYYGLKAGLLTGTVASLVKAMFGASNILVELLVVVIVIAALSAVVRAWRKRDRSSAALALMVACLLLVADASARAVLFHLNGTLYPEDRTALQWVPMFLVMLAFSIDLQVARSGVWRWSAILFLAFPLKMLFSLNLSATSYWPEEAIPDKVFDAAAERQARSPDLLTVGAYHQMPPCWSFGLRERGLHLNTADAIGFPNGGTDLLMIDPSKMQAPAGHHVLATTDRVCLLERDVLLSRTLVLDTTIAAGISDHEFNELWHPAMDGVRGHAYLVELGLTIDAEEAPLVIDLVGETDADGTDRHYESALLQFSGGGWHGDTLHTVRRIPLVSDAARRTVVYFWDPGRHRYAYHGRMRVFRLGTPE